jgi:hypothetical protein
LIRKLRNHTNPNPSRWGRKGRCEEDLRGSYLDLSPPSLPPSMWEESRAMVSSPHMPARVTSTATQPFDGGMLTLGWTNTPAKGRRRRHHPLWPLWTIVVPPVTSGGWLLLLSLVAAQIRRGGKGSRHRPCSLCGYAREKGGGEGDRMVARVSGERRLSEF